MYVERDANRLLPKPKATVPSPKRMMPSKAQPMAPAHISQELPSSPRLKAVAHQMNRLHPNSTFFTPQQAKQAHSMYEHNASPLVKLGSHVEGFLRLRGTGKQLANSFDPRSRGGLANIASLFAGGPEGLSEGEASRGFEAEMPGQFERYSTAKAAAGGHLSSDESGWIHTPNGAHPLSEVLRVAKNHPDPVVRANAMKLIHDHFFDGEVHAVGDIPPQP